MKDTMLRAIGLPAMLLTFALTAGCATSPDIGAVTKLAQEAKDSADQANRAAAEAAAAAAEAKTAAAAAQRTAEEAKTAAQQNSEKLDRAFKKSMRK